MYTKYTQKGDFFFFFPSLLNASKSSCTFRAIRIKEYLYINKKKEECSLGASAFVYQLIRCIPGHDVTDGCG